MPRRDRPPPRDRLSPATRRRWRHLAEERLDTVKPTIPLGKRFWPLIPEERKALSQMFASDSVRPTLTSLRGRTKDDPIELLDAAYWMKGCSSLGRLRFAVLLGVGKNPVKNGGYCLIDVKEAVQAAAPRDAKAVMPRDNAMRVVEGARHLSPALGERMLRIAGEQADGTALWMVGPKTLAAHVTPTITAAARDAGRPAPRILTGLPICITNDPAAARERAARALARYGQLPSYRAMLDREGAAGPADVALLGSESEVERQLAQLEEAGATDFTASPMGSADEQQRTFEVLGSLVAHGRGTPV